MIFDNKGKAYLSTIPSITPPLRNYLLQWITASVVGVALGVYVLVASSLPSQWTILLVFLVLCPFVLMVVGNVYRVLLAIIILDTPLQIDINLKYHTEAADLGAMGGLNISITTLALAALYALWLTKLLAKNDSTMRSLFRHSLPLAAFVFFVTLSVWVASDTDLALFQIFLFWQTFMLFLYTINCVRTRQDIRFVLVMLLVGLILESTLMIGQRLLDYSAQFGGGILSLDMLGSRVAGTLRHPNTAASYLSMLIAPVMSLLLIPVARTLKWLAAFGLFLGSAALVFTLSRGGWTACVVSVSILCLFAGYRRWISQTLLILAAVVALLLFFNLQDTVAARLLGDDGGSAEGRWPLMQLAFRMIQEKPLFGVGANNFSIMIKEYATPEFRGTWLYTVHNYYLLIWAEAGIGGIVAFGWFLLATLQKGWQGWQHGDRFLALTAIAFSASIVGNMVHMGVDLFNTRPTIQMLWFLAALVIAIHNMALQRANAQTMSSVG